jgi:hypothetical protein
MGQLDSTCTCPTVRVDGRVKNKPLFMTNIRMVCAYRDHPMDGSSMPSFHPYVEMPLFPRYFAVKTPVDDSQYRPCNCPSLSLYTAQEVVI